MRKLRRPVLVVPTLGAQGVGGKKRAEQAQHFEEDGTLPTSFPIHWTRPDVRGALYGMQGRVCAYCGADIAEAGIDVEHFRPKSNVNGDAEHGGYWWLAYDFDNYFLSCIVCNQKYKRDKFPLQNGVPRCRYQERDRLAREERLLLDPTVDPVEDWISVEWQKPACRLAPKQGLGPELTARVDQCLRFFRVNLRAAQRRRRAEIQRLVIEKISENKLNEVRTLAIRYRPHSLVARQILQATAPQALPTPLEELNWLLEELTSELIQKLEDISDVANVSELDENEAKELLWALAALWRDPPAGSPADVATFLENRGLDEHVKDYVEQLQ